MDSLSDVKKYELFYWSLLFGAVAIYLIYFRIKFDDSIERNYGITFLFKNLYTRYFEYFRNSTHKAVFFTILAVSFWYIDYKAEKIGVLSLLNEKKVKPARILIKQNKRISSNKKALLCRAFL